jgi:hypothetical protein
MKRRAQEQKLADDARLVRACKNFHQKELEQNAWRDMMAPVVTVTDTKGRGFRRGEFLHVPRPRSGRKNNENTSNHIYHSVMPLRIGSKLNRGSPHRERAPTDDP